MTTHWDRLGMTYEEWAAASVHEKFSRAQRRNSERITRGLVLSDHHMNFIERMEQGNWGTPPPPEPKPKPYPMTHDEERDLGYDDLRYGDPHDRIGPL